MLKLFTAVNFNLSTVFFQSSCEMIKSFPALMVCETANLCNSHSERLLSTGSEEMIH